MPAAKRTFIVAMKRPDFKEIFHPDRFPETLDRQCPSFPVMMSRMKISIPTQPTGAKPAPAARPPAILDCGGKRSATPLSPAATTPFLPAAPASGKSLTTHLGSFPIRPLCPIRPIRLFPTN